ncbi:Membrane protein involved in the export of O-antigen and teichoic acid [Rhodoferax sp. OV413]|nr:Membrane protein involved in the export of O-antigen and teichoic acid [Rhodoferax sp. OV413]
MLDNLAQQVLSFLVFMVLARFVAPQEFGLIAIAHVIVTFVRQTVFDAISHPVARAESTSDTLYSWAFSVCVLAALCMSILMLAGAGFVSRFYAHPELVQVLSWMSLVVLATGTASVYEARLVRRMEFRPLAIRSIVSVTIGGTVGIVLAFRGAGVMALVAQQVVTSCLALALLVAQARWIPQIALRNLAFKEFLPEASRVSMTGLFNFLASQGDTVLVSIFLGSYATGIYNFAKRLTSAVYLVIGSSLLKLAIPAFAEAGKNPDALRDAYVRILGTTIFLMAPLLAGMSILAIPTITLLFGAVWVEAAPIVALLSILYILLAANQINDYLMFATGSRTVPMQRGLVQTLLALLLGWMFSGLGLGLAWTSVGFVLAGAIVWPWPQRLANSRMHFSFLKLISALKSPLLATTAMSLFLMATYKYMPLNIWALGCMVSAGALTFFITHLIVIKMWPSSYDALKELIRRRHPSTS